MYLWPLTCDKILQQYRDNGGTKEAQIQYKSEGSGSPPESSYQDWARLQTLYDPYATKSSETGYAISLLKSQFLFIFFYNMLVRIYVPEWSGWLLIPGKIFWVTPCWECPIFCRLHLRLYSINNYIIKWRHSKCEIGFI